MPKMKHVKRAGAQAVAMLDRLPSVDADPPAQLGVSINAST